MDADRRKLLKAGAAAAALAVSPRLAGIIRQGFMPAASARTLSATAGGIFNPVEAMFYEKLEHKRIRCLLCPKKCGIGNKERGFCGVRENQEGVYYSLVHSNPCSLNLDPVEKKPLFHFLPGTGTLSLATAGCNFDCKFCQNWEISQSRPEQTRNFHLTPEDIASLAAEHGAASISYTYGEPIIFYEYMLDCARAGAERDLRSVMISNGYIEPEPLDLLLEELAGVKVDFKAFSEGFYEKTCLGNLEPVLEAIKRVKARGRWLELVVLLIPTLNDDPGEVRDMCRWVVDNVGPDVPMHFSRFHPTYKLRNLPPTPQQTIERSYEIARQEGVRYVYAGNVPGHEAESTYCHSCGSRVIGRHGFRVTSLRLRNGACPDCGTRIPGVWS